MPYFFSPKCLGVPGFALSLLTLFLLGCEGKTETAAGPGGGRPPAEVAQVYGVLRSIDLVSWPKIAQIQGSLFADEATALAAKVSGRVVAVECDLGDQVTAGQQVIKLDDREFQLRVQQAESQLKQVRAAIGLKEGDPIESLNPMNSPPVREAQAILEEANQQINRLQALFEQGAVVATDIEVALSEQRVADARYNSALNSVREKIALVGVQTAQLELAKQELADTSIVVPFDGMIQRRSVAVGTYVQPGVPLVELTKTSVLRFRASVPERFAQQLAVGQKVRLTVDRQQLEVRVTRISPILDPISRSLSFEADVANPDNRLRSGLFAQAEIVLDEDSQAIAIPMASLVRFAGVDKVWKVANGKVTENVVQIGRESQDYIEVVSGLDVGDQILAAGKQGRVGDYSGESPPAQTAADESPAQADTTKLVKQPN